MIRNRIFGSFPENKFQHRGKEIFRIEALSDAIFGFSVSLLVASLEVPKTFAELKSIAMGAIPFFATVAMLFLFWYQQYVFFRRYGLNDLTTILLNLGYLAIILFYVYPLKFLFSILLSYWSGINFSSEGHETMSFLLSGDFPQLIMLFSIGYTLIWLIIYLNHRHVLKLANNLELNAYELLFTKTEAGKAIWNTVVGFLALGFAWLNQPLFASLCFIFIPVIMIVNDYRFKQSLKKIKPVTRQRRHKVLYRTSHN